MPDPFTTLRDAWLSELDPSLYSRPACPLEPLLSQPATGRQLWGWASSVQDSPRRRHYASGLGGLLDAIAWEGRRRGYGTYYLGYTREQVEVLYAWAVERVREWDGEAAGVEERSGPIKRTEPRRPRGA